MSARGWMVRDGAERHRHTVDALELAGDFDTVLTPNEVVQTPGALDSAWPVRCPLCGADVGVPCKVDALSLIWDGWHLGRWEAVPWDRRPEVQEYNRVRLLLEREGER